MTINPKTLELRNLIPTQRPEGVKCCGVCGKPDASMTKAAKELPTHKQALAEDWPGLFRNLTRAVGGAEKLMDFATRKEFNAQLESLRTRLTAAREEHDNMPVVETPRTDKARLVDTLGKTAALLGLKFGDDAKPADMADRIHEELGILMALKEDAASSQPDGIGLHNC
jgi:hypothetical protein